MLWRRPHAEPRVETRGAAYARSVCAGYGRLAQRARLPLEPSGAGPLRPRFVARGATTELTRRSTTSSPHGLRAPRSAAGAAPRRGSGAVGERLIEGVSTYETKQRYLPAVASSRSAATPRPQSVHGTTLGPREVGVLVRGASPKTCKARAGRQDGEMREERCLNRRASSRPFCLQALPISLPRAGAATPRSCRASHADVPLQTTCRKAGVPLPASSAAA